MKSTFDSVSFWNQVCSKPAPLPGTDAYWEAVENQAMRCLEEVLEIQEAVVNRDIDNLVKEGCDLDVVTSGLNYIIGADYPVAIGRVLTNNNLKVTQNTAEADAWCKYYRDKEVEDESYGVFCSIIEGLRYYCVKRVSDDKVMKRPGMQPPHLLDLVPEVRSHGS